MLRDKSLRSNLSIGFVATRVYPDIGGPAKHVFELSKALRNYGAIISTITCTPRSRMYFEEDASIGIIRLPISSVPRYEFVPRILFIISFLLLGTITAIIQFARSRVQIIHAHSPAVTGLVALIVAKLLHLHLVYTVHGLDRWSHNEHEKQSIRVKSVLEEAIVSKSDAVITVSPDYYDHLSGICSRHTVYTIGNGVDTHLFRPIKDAADLVKTRSKLGMPLDKIVIVYIGNFYLPEKLLGLKDLMYAFEHIEGGIRDKSHLIIVGDGPSRKKLEELATSLGISSNISFFGYRKNIPEILQASNIFILPSRHEGSPLALLEALSSGLACIVTRVGAIPQILGEAGWIVEPANINDLARTISEVLMNPSTVQKMGIMGRKRAIAYHSWASIAKEIMKVYSDLYS